MRVWLFSLLLLVSVAQADEIDGLLTRMQQALGNHNFQGTLIIRQQDQLHTMHVVHGHGDNAQDSWDTLESMSGEQRRVIRHNAQVITMYPGKNTATIVRDNRASNMKVLPLHPLLPQNLATLKQFYQLRLAGEDRVAGWPAQIIEMLPRDRYRYGFRLWLARDNGLLLRCDLIGEQGQVVEQAMYSQLSIIKQIPPPGVPDLTTWQVVDMDAGLQPALTAADTEQWQVKQLPTGFRLIQSTVMPAGVPGMKVDAVSGSAAPAQIQHLIFSDGMTSVSVFIEQRVPNNKLLVGVSRMGPVNAFGQALNGHHVTVLGEAPMLTVRQIAQSIAQVETPHD